MSTDRCVEPANNVPDAVGHDADLDLKAMYRSMVLIRRFEQVLVAEFVDRGKRGEAPTGPLHSSEGQEAVSVGVCAAMRPGDYLFSTYRGHGHALAHGLEPRAVAAEILGRATGISGGFGGSMHLFAPAVGFMGGNGIVAGGLPIALGTAYASTYRGDERATVAFFGDGGSAQGAFHEALNMAAVMRWPVVFVCENNQYAATTHVSVNCPIDDVAGRAAAYGIPGIVADGNDPVEVTRHAVEAIRRARDGMGPTLIECKTYRHRPHSLGVVEHRPEPERRHWNERDPIDRLRVRLVDLGLLSHDEDARIQDEMAEVADDAIRFALGSPFPSPDALRDGDINVAALAADSTARGRVVRP